MKLIHHKNLDIAKWYKSSILYQMANIGSEVSRTISWRDKGRPKYADQAFERALELIDLTIEDPKNIDRLSEIIRVREQLGEWKSKEDIDEKTEAFWKKYFADFTFAARKEAGKL